MANNQSRQPPNLQLGRDILGRGDSKRLPTMETYWKAEHLALQELHAQHAMQLASQAHGGSVSLPQLTNREVGLLRSLEKNDWDANYPYRLRVGAPTRNESSSDKRRNELLAGMDSCKTELQEHMDQSLDEKHMLSTWGGYTMPLQARDVADWDRTRINHGEYDVAEGSSQQAGSQADRTPSHSSRATTGTESWQTCGSVYSRHGT